MGIEERMMAELDTIETTHPETRKDIEKIRKLLKS